MDVLDAPPAAVAGPAVAVAGDDSIQLAANDASGVTQKALALTTSGTSTDVTQDYEAAFTGLAPGWKVNWWGSVAPQWTVARETNLAYVHAGTASQRWSIDSLPSGSGVHLVRPYAFVQGATYESTVWMRAAVAGTEVEVQIRRDVSPYNVVASTKVTLGTAWQSVRVAGTYSYADAGSVRVIGKLAGQPIFLDDFVLRRTSSADPLAVQLTADGALVLPAAGPRDSYTVPMRSSDMEGTWTRFDPAWYFNSFGGTSTAQFVASRETRAGWVHGGSSSQRFQVVDKMGGDIHLISTYPGVQGQRYRATAWMRADGALSAKLFLRRDEAPWEAFAAANVTLSDTWQKVVIEGTYLGSGPASLRVSINAPTGTVYLDDTLLEEVHSNPLAPFGDGNVAATSFGMHVNRFGTHQNWPGLSTAVVRLHDSGTTWRDLQPSGNTWDFTTGGGKRLDMYVDYITRNGGQVLYTMGQTPTWASSTPTVTGKYGAGSSGAPSDMQTWRGYVRTLANRYKGRIRYWELWNEPDYKPFWGGTDAQLVQMATIAKQELAAADPSNVLIGPGLTAGTGLAALDRLFAAGIGSAIDAVGYHMYYSANPEMLVTRIQNVRDVMARYGASAKPLWVTEGAFICDAAAYDCSVALPTRAQLRSGNARAMLLYASQGVANFNFYMWESQDAWRQLVLTDYVTPTEASRTFAESRSWVKGARVSDGYALDGVYMVRLERDGISSIVLWSVTPGRVVALPSTWAQTSVRNLDGAVTAVPSTRRLTLGLEPVILR